MMKPKGRRGIYVLPSLVTTGSLLCGFYAAVSAINGHFVQAAVALLICVVLDGLDGNIARLTNTTSRFGAELDSLTDAVVFGFVTALVAYQWALYTLAHPDWLWGKLNWLIAFFYVVTTIFRLARFNLQEGVASKHFFRGLPCPAATVLIASFIWLWEDLGYSAHQVGWLVAALMIFSGIAMVSNFSYLGLKGVQWKTRVPFIVLLLFTVGLLLAIVDLPKFLFVFMLLYLVSGPALYLVRLFKKNAARARVKHRHL